MKSIAEQATERGVPFPVGKTVKDLFFEEWEIPIDVPDNAVYGTLEGTTVPSVEGTQEPTGYGWRSTAGERLQHLAIIWEDVIGGEKYKENLPHLRDHLVALVEYFKERSVAMYNAGFRMAAQYEVSKQTFAAVMLSKLDSRSE